MKNLVLTLTMLIACSVSLIQAQTTSITGVKSFQSGNSGSIFDNNEVLGYYSFYVTDKVSRREKKYLLQIMDNNMKVSHEIEFVKSKYYYFLESAYNGEALCFSFYNAQFRRVEYLLYSREGEKLGETNTNELNSAEIEMIFQVVGDEDNNYSGGLTAIPNEGFVRYEMDYKKGVWMKMVMFDNNGKQQWIADSNTKAKKAFESGIPFYSDENIVATFFSTRSKRMSVKDQVSMILFHDAQSGDLLFQSEPIKAKKKFMPNGVSYDAISNAYMVYGEYYDFTDRIGKDESKGLYFQSLNADGKLQSEGFASWKEDIYPNLPAGDDLYDKDANLTIHNMLRTADGKVFAVGEQFKKTASALGIAGAMLGGETALVQLTILNLVVFEFNDNLEVQDIKVYEKDKSRVQLPQGAGLNSPTALAYFARFYGAFDYRYTTTANNFETFSVAYINFDREKGEKNNYVVGNLLYDSENQELVSDLMKLDDRPSSFAVYPAKPGYFGLIKYYKRDDRLRFSLEKMNL
ncbi:DUF6770 family protein [Halocola ammonii]